MISRASQKYKVLTDLMNHNGQHNNVAIDRLSKKIRDTKGFVKIVLVTVSLYMGGALEACFKKGN
jgi:hypothetical protein